MTSLASAHDAETSNLLIDEPVDLEPGALIRIDDELVQFRAYQTNKRSRTRIIRTELVVSRGVYATTAAEHAEGAELLGANRAVTVSAEDLNPPSPFASDGGPGAVGVVEAPEGTWAAETEFVEGDQILVATTDEREVAMVAQFTGITGTEEPDWNAYIDNGGRNNNVADGSQEWAMLGWVGGIAIMVLPAALEADKIANPAGASAQDVAEALNTLIDKLRRSGYLDHGPIP